MLSLRALGTAESVNYTMLAGHTMEQRIGNMRFPEVATT